jgi:WD repeat-containing protein 19
VGQRRLCHLAPIAPSSRSLGARDARFGAGQLLIHDRHGKKVHEASLETRGGCRSLAWAFDGSVSRPRFDNERCLTRCVLQAIALTQFGSSKISIFEMSSKAISSISNSAVSSPTIVRWALHEPILAVGDATGNVLLYNLAVRRAIPVSGKHTAEIVSGEWSHSGVLALGAKDDSVTVSSSEGDTIESIDLRGEPTQLAFATRKNEGGARAGVDSTLTVNMGGKSLFLIDVSGGRTTEKPMELSFQPKYGSIEAFQWFGDGYVGIGFRQGYFTVISTHRKELGTELFSAQVQHDPVKSIAVSHKLQQVAVASNSLVRIVDLREALDGHSVPTVSAMVVSERLGPSF